MLPGGMGALEYGNTFSLRLPIDVAITEQSEVDAVSRLLQQEIDGTGDPTGFEPANEDSTVIVSFTTCVLHAAKDPTHSASSPRA